MLQYDAKINKQNLSTVEVRIMERNRDATRRMITRGKSLFPFTCNNTAARERCDRRSNLAEHRQSFPSSEGSVIKQEKDVAGKREPCLLLDRSVAVFPYELIAEPVTVRPYHPPTTRGTLAARISDRRVVLARFVLYRRQASSFIRSCFVSGSLGHKLFVFRDRMDQYAFSRGRRRGAVYTI